MSDENTQNTTPETTGAGGSTTGGTNAGNGTPAAETPTLNADGSITLPVVTTAPVTTTPGAEDFLKQVPDTYKAKEWVQNIVKSEKPNKLEMVFDMYENAQKRIGEKGLQLPGDNATPEDLKAFYKQLGVPVDVSEGHKLYKLPEIQWEEKDKPIGDLINSSRSDAFVEALQKDAMALGITPKQFTQLVERHDKNLATIQRAQLDQVSQNRAAQEAGFEADVTRIFGDRKDAAIDNVKKLLPHLPADRKGVLEKLSNDQLAGVAVVLDYFSQKFMGEDKFNTTNVTATDAASLQSQRHEVLKKLQDPAIQNNQTEYKKFSAQLTDLNNKMRELDKIKVGAR